MTNPTQIPASEVERIEREAKEFNIGPRSIMIDSWNEGFDEGYIAGAKSEYLRREREARELIALADAHLKDLYEYASGHEVMSHVHGWRISTEEKIKFFQHREKWEALKSRLSAPEPPSEP